MFGDEVNAGFMDCAISEVGAEEHENFLFAAHLEEREFRKTIIFRDSFSAELGTRNGVLQYKN